jgi:catechol 2,3-dioxygenase-like lactoylglutathione lyase family enzyme
MRATAILETVIYADDPETCAAFYRRVLGLEEVRAVPGRFSFLRCGSQMLLIFAPGPSSDPAQQNGIPAHGARGPGHLCFRAADAAELAQWEAHLRAAGVAVELRHDWGTGRSVYFRDPAGNSAEIAEAAIWGPG